MTRGVILIAVADGAVGQQPRRTGGLVLVPDAMLRAALEPEAFTAFPA
jgi:hypothetical protein